MIRLLALFLGMMWASLAQGQENLAPSAHPLLAAGQPSERAQLPAKTTKKPTESKSADAKSASKAPSSKSSAEKNTSHQKSSEKTQGSAVTVVVQCRQRPSAEAVKSDADQELAVDRRALIKRALDAKSGQKSSTDWRWVHSIYETLHLSTCPEKAQSIQALQCLTRARTGAWQLGDLVFFASSSAVPPVGVVRSCKGSVCEILVQLRGAVRPIFADFSRPHLRREGDTLVNSFLRAPRPEDAKGTAYLAGELIEAVGTLLD